MSISRYIEYITFERKYSKHTQLAYSKDLERFQQFCQETFEEQDIDQLPYSIIRSWIVALVVFLFFCFDSRFLFHSNRVGPILKMCRFFKSVPPHFRIIARGFQQ